MAEEFTRNGDADEGENGKALSDRKIEGETETVTNSETEQGVTTCSKVVETAEDVIDSLKDTWSHVGFDEFSVLSKITSHIAVKQ